MTSEQAVAILRTLDLPSGRRVELIRQAVTAPDDAERLRIIYRSRAEVASNQRAALSAYEEEKDARSAYQSRNPAETRREPYMPARTTYGERERAEPPRPVRVSWATPKRPEVVRESVGLVDNPVASFADIARKTEAARIEADAVPKPAPIILEGVEHGTRGYKRGCRCEPCRTAKRLSRKSPGKRRNRAEDSQHGSLTRYTKLGCRCDICRAGVAEHARNYRERRAF